MKWLWRFTQETLAFWVEVIVSLYVSLEWLPIVKSIKGRSLRKEIDKVKEIFLRLLKFKVEDGKRIRLWEDLWVEETPFSHHLSRFIHSLTRRGFPFQIGGSEEVYLIESLVAGWRSSRRSTIL